MLHRIQQSEEISLEGNDIKDVDLDLFWNYHMPTRNVDGNKSNVFNCKTFYRSIHWIIVGLNDYEKEINASNIMIAV